MGQELKKGAFAARWDPRARGCCCVSLQSRIGESGINGLLPAARVPSIYSVSPLRVLDSRLTQQREVTVICVWKIPRIFESQIGSIVTKRQPGVFVLRQLSQIELTNALPTKEDLKKVLLLSSSKSNRRPGKGLSGIKPMAFKTHLSLCANPSHLVAAQILGLRQLGRHQPATGLIMTGRGIQPQGFMGTLEIVRIAKGFKAFPAVLVIEPDGALG